MLPSPSAAAASSTSSAPSLTHRTHPVDPSHPHPPHQHHDTVGGAGVYVVGDLAGFASAQAAVHSAMYLSHRFNKGYVVSDLESADLPAPSHSKQDEPFVYVEKGKAVHCGDVIVLDIPTNQTHTLVQTAMSSVFGVLPRLSVITVPAWVDPILREFYSTR